MTYQILSRQALSSVLLRSWEMCVIWSFFASATGPIDPPGVYRVTPDLGSITALFAQQTHGTLISITAFR
jgi:hypothetical protein